MVNNTPNNGQMDEHFQKDRVHEFLLHLIISDLELLNKDDLYDVKFILKEFIALKKTTKKITKYKMK